MGKIVILEGPDGAGKTTLAQRLEKDYNFKYAHEGPPPVTGSALEHYAQKLLDALRRGHNTVFDRLHLGELVYGPIARNEDRLGYYGMRMMNRLIRSRMIAVWICLPSFDTCSTNWKRKDTDFVRNEQKLEDVYYRFRALCAYHKRWDYENVDGTAIDRFLYDLDVTSEHGGTLPTGSIGAPRTARFVFVGEQPATDLDLPFFGDGESSGYLNRALWDAGYLEDELVLTNALNPANVERKIEQVLVRVPHHVVTIALGRVAERVCRSQGIKPFVTVSHPQYHKRFHSNERKKYVKQLADIRRRWLNA